MKLNKDRKIIFEDDIILSDGSTSLSERFDSLEHHLKKLDGETKWLYKYGGTGSGKGGGSGTGGGSIKEFSIYATLAEMQLTGSTITLPSTGQYTLNIRINKPGGLKYYVRYINNNNRSAQLVLDSTNGWQTTVSLRLNTNANLIVTATNEDNETKLVSCSYITTPYEITSALRANNGSLWSRYINISLAAENGVSIITDYSIYVDTRSVDYSITFNGNEVVSTTILDAAKGSFSYTIPSELFQDSNAGYYSGLVVINITTQAQQVLEVRDFNFLLIPESLYLLFSPNTPSALIYTLEVDNPYIFQLGSNPFIFTVYDGSATGTNYEVQFVINGNTAGARSYSGVRSLTELSIDLFSATEGWNTIQASVTNTLNGQVYTHQYMYYVGASSVDINWPSSSVWYTLNYYRAGEVTPAFNKLNGNVYTQINALDREISISGLKNGRTSTSDKPNTHIAISLLLSEINNDDTPLFSFKSSSGSTLLSITPTLLQRTSAIFKLITVEKEPNLEPGNMLKYHLIDIYSTYRQTIGNTPLNEISLYIDGVLEASLPSLIEEYLNVETLIIHPFNGYINLLDIEYKLGEGAETDAEYDVYTYYLKYANSFLLKTDIQTDLTIADTIKSGFHFDPNTGRIQTTTAVADTLARSLDVPTLVFEINAANSSIESIISAIEELLTENLQDNYKLIISKIYWHPGKSDALSLSEITGKPEQSLFLITKQGSSTKNYRVKNFELTLVSTNSDEGYYYSPNFSNEDPTTFLPEESFTLKADIVDSSHSNNTASGKFVNTVTKQFYSINSKYGKYIKNCLDGFPIVLYINITKVDAITGELTSTCYYLGVYNFNLGRKSYFNLGYKSLVPFEELGLDDAGSGFTFATIKNPTLNSSIVKGLGVAEVTNNSGYFDFSLFHPSILHQLQGDAADQTYMYGDLVYGDSENSVKAALNKLTEQVSRAGGYLFTYLKKNFGSPEDKYKKERIYGGETQSANLVPDYKILYTKTMVNGSPVYTPNNTEISPVSDIDLSDLIVGNEDADILKYLDYQSLSEYYTICMVLGLVDSVLKNLNLKTWTINPLDPSSPATWFLAFYDMDTCLGVDNSGKDINPLAFSDYWTSEVTKLGGRQVKPESARIYADYGPSSLGNSGFDTASSYLFAVAKYARMIFNSEDNNGDVTRYFPLELYAKWRSPIINKEDNLGILVNADTFVDRFFASNLASVNKALISYNYRSKYFKLNGRGWTALDFGMFNGTRLTKVRTWLNKRLHLLDLYFGLNSNIRTSVSYCTEDGPYQDVLINGSPIYYPIYENATYLLSLNPDILILQNIFNKNGTALKTTNSDTIYVTTPDYTPTLVANSNEVLGLYILNSGVENQLSLRVVGNLALSIGGSTLWTDISRLNMFLINSAVGAGSFELYSSNLKHIIVTDSNDDGTMPYCNNVIFETPAVEVIKLNSPGISGELSCTELLKWPNLNTVDLSGTQLSVNLSNLNVASVILNKIENPGGSISIANCGKLSSLSLDGTVVKSLSLSNIPVTKYDLSTMQAEDVIILATEGSGATFVMKNNSKVKSLVLRNFKSVNIESCTNIDTILLIGDVTDLVISGGHAAISTLGENYETGVVDISNLDKLKNIIILNTTVTTIKLPDKTILLEGALSGNTLLQYLDGSHIVATGSSTFKNCNAFTLTRSTDHRYCDIKFTSTDLSGTFELTSAPPTGAIDLSTARTFVTKMVEDPKVVTNIARLFKNQVGIGTISLISSAGNIFKDFEAVQNASLALYNTGINLIAGETVHFGVEDIDLTEFIVPMVGDNVRSIYITPETLSQLPEKCVKWPIGNMSNTVYYLCSTNGVFENNADAVIKLSDYFNVSEYISELTTELELYLFIVNGTLDCTDFFDTKFPNLQKLTNFGNGTNLRQLKARLKDGQFKNLKKLTIFRNSFKTNISIEGGPFNLIELFAWDDIYKNNPLTTINGGVNVYINYADINKLLDTILTTKATNIDYLFYLTKIMNPDSLDIELGSDGENNQTITSAVSLFEDAREYRNDTTPSSLHLSTKLFKRLDKLANLNRAFANTNLANALGLNFFNKRNNDGTYRLELTNLVSLFENSVFDTQYTGEPIIDVNLAESVLGTAPYLADKEYENNLLAVRQAAQLCIPSDFFYGVTANGNISKAFTTERPNTGVAGVIPEKIFLYNPACIKTDLFKNLYIVPRYVGTYLLDGESTKVYLYYPDGYTTNDSISNVFNCSLSIPSSGVHIIISSKSIPSVVTSASTPFLYGGLLGVIGLNNTIKNPLSFIGNINDGKIVLGWDISANSISGTVSNLFVSRYLPLMSGSLFTDDTYLAKNGYIRKDAYSVLYGQNVVGCYVHGYNNRSEVTDKYGSSSINSDLLSAFLKFPYATDAILFNPNTPEGKSFIGPPSSTSQTRYIIKASQLVTTQDSETNLNSLNYYKTAGNIGA